MAKKSTSKTAKLLIRMRTTRMTRKEMVEFLLGSKTLYKPGSDRGTYNALLYGTRERYGILERFTRQYADGTYKTVKPVEGPFTPRRAARPTPPMGAFVL